MKRQQIALEFMIIFSFVLVMFLFLFVLISSQRAQILNSQIFSQEQLIGQSVASQLDRAAQAGNGYTAVVPVVGSIGTLSYQMILTKNGVIIINASVGKQTMQSMTYSSVRNMVSNPLYLQSGYYNLPISNGTITIQNSFGTICVDYSCPTASNFASNVTISTQVVHAANFDGKSSLVTIANNPVIQLNGAFTLSFWLKVNSVSMANYDGAFSQGNSGPSGTGWVVFYAVPAGLVTPFYKRANTQYLWGGGSLAPVPNQWRNYIVTYDGAGNLYLYTNGAQTNYYSTTLPTDSDASPLIFGKADDYSAMSLSGVQIYNSFFTAPQVNSLYQGGIGGAPLGLSSLVGWWPLNGDANDYSTKGNNGIVTGPMLFTTAAQISAKVMNSAGQPVSGDLVGFTTTLGNLTAGASFSNFTNANGIATTFLNQQGNNGQATVEAVALNGNVSLSSNVLSWMPLGTGQGNVVYAFSGNSPGSGTGNGALQGYAYWSSPNYMASIDGQTPSSFISTTLQVNLASSPYSFSSWVYVQNVTANPSSASEGIIWDNKAGIGLSVAPSGSGFGVMPWAGGTASVWGSYTLNAWHDITVVYPNAGSPTRELFVDGQYAGTESDGSVPSASTIYLGGDYNYLQSPSVKMSDAQVYNAVLTPSQVLQLYQSGIQGIPAFVPVSPFTQAWWPLDGDAIDYTGNGYNGAIYGNSNFASTSQIPSGNGNATRVLVSNFDSSQESMVPTNANIGDNINNLTVVFWIDSTCGCEHQFVVSKDNGLSLRSWNVGVYSANSIAAYLWTTTGIANVITPLALLPSTWDQVVFVYNGSYMKLYLNGALSALTPKTGTIVSNANVPVTIGASFLSGNTYNGKLSDIQIYNNSLTSAQIQQLYQQGITATPVTNGNVIGWWPLNGNTRDYSQLGNNATSVNVLFTSEPATYPYLMTSLGGYGLQLNGVGYFDSPFTSNGVFSVSFWMYKGAWSLSCGAVMGKQNTYLGLPSTFAITSLTQNACNPGSEQNTQLNFRYLSAGGVPYDGMTSLAKIPALVWTHAVVTFNSISGNMKWYINGANTANYTALSPIGTDTYPLRVGYDSALFNGSIADVRFFNIDLLPTQVKQLYQASVPPTASATVPLRWIP